MGCSQEFFTQTLKNLGLQENLIQYTRGAWNKPYFKAILLSTVHSHSFCLKTCLNTPDHYSFTEAGSLDFPRSVKNLQFEYIIVRELKEHIQGVTSVVVSHIPNFFYTMCIYF